MPYRVTYGPPITTKAQKQDNFSRLRALTASFLVAFALLVRLFFPAGCTQLRTILLPDPEDVTQAALEFFMSDLRNGEALSDALYTFCAHIVAHDPAIPG